MARNHRVRPKVSFLTATAVAAAVLSFARPAFSEQAPPWDAPTSDVTLQDWSDQVPAHVSAAEGDAWLDREGVVEGEPSGVPLLAGDRVRTRAGRLEVLFSDGSVVSLDEYTDAELLSDNLLRLDRGHIRVDLAREGAAAGYRIDAAGTTTWLRAAGEYRIDITERNAAASDVRLLVVRGLAELSANDGRTLVSTGAEAFGSADTRPSAAYTVAVSRWDSFDRWWDGRRNIRAGVPSSRYLPTEIAYYGGVLERDGDWEYDRTHGYVWYPRVVSTWQPYASGRWTFVGTYGWVWVGADRWAWPTHHYGRWGYTGQRYYWIPGRQWAPAWVSWASSPSYVGWVPLGYNNRPLISVQLGYSSGWRGWTHAPRQSFGATIVVSNRARYLPPRGSQFTDRYRGPGRPATIDTRTQPAGLRGPAGIVRSSVAVPRSPGVRQQPSVAPISPGRQPAPRTAPTARTSRPVSAASGNPVIAPSRSSRPMAAPRVQERRVTPSPGVPSPRTPAPVVGGRPSALPSAPGRISRPGPAAGGDDAPRTPILRNRAPAERGLPAARPAQRLPNPGSAVGPGPRTERSRPAPAPAATPGRTRSAGVRAPQQAPRVQSERPAARQAPSEPARARAVPRNRD